jgi:hypothetical protein
MSKEFYKKEDKQKIDEILKLTEITSSPNSTEDEKRQARRNLLKILTPKETHTSPNTTPKEQT